MRLLIRFLRIYTPFICTIMVLVNGVLFCGGKATGDFLFISSATTGHSLVVIGYFFATSLRMCIWYKLNLACLLAVQVCGLLYKYTDMGFTTYVYLVILISAIGILCFLIFRTCYKVTSLFLCTNRYLPESETH